MSEILAVLNGLVLGAIAGLYQPTNRRPFVLLACIMGGILASLVGQLAHPQPTFFLLDFVLVVVASAIGLFSARRLSPGRRN